MTLPRRSAARTVQHEKLSSVDIFNQPDTYEFAPGQRVHTVDGLFGVVQAVLGNSFGAQESYEVNLEGGMGQGEYSATQITAAHEVEGSIETTGTAAEFYPELQAAITDHPNPAGIEVYASRKTAGETPNTHAYEGTTGTCKHCGEPAHRDEDDGHWVHSLPLEPGEDASGDHEADGDGTDRNHYASKTATDGHYSDLDEHGHITHDGNSAACGGHDDYSMLPGDSDANSAENKSQHTSLLVQAAVDPDLRFHITAAWRDVQAKAKRIRSTGGVHIVASSHGFVIGEIQGDNGVYEAGLQRVPGRTAAVQAYSCGCKWAGYHSNQDKGTSRYAGRMCSHALALQYEAQSRGMFGRDVYADDKQPAWVPARVKVKYDPDNRDFSYARTSAKRQVPTDAPLQHFAHQAWLDREPVEDVVLSYRTAGIHPSLIKQAVDQAWGVDSMVPRGQGGTRPAYPTENPASNGPLTAADPKEWDHPEISPVPKQTFENTATVKTAIDPLSFAPNTPSAQPAQQQQQQSGGDDKSGGGAPPGAGMALKGLMPSGGGAAAAGGAAEGGAAAAGGAAAEGGMAAGLARLAPLLLMARRSIAGLMDAPAESSVSFDADGSGDPTSIDMANAVAGGQTESNDPDVDETGLQATSMARTAMKDFTDAERSEIINEGRQVRASNVDRMDISGTHYEHQRDEDDDDFGFLG